jgi:predicted AAA+ superfamily ATPase
MIDKLGKDHIDRFIKLDILRHVEANKVVVIYGPRRVGKTTLAKEVASELGESVRWVSGEDLDVRSWLSSLSLEKLKAFVGSTKTLVIDEAQWIDQIGLNLKIMVDMIPDLRIIATGSSSFELANQVGEPLVGRKWTYYLYPVAQLELAARETVFETGQKLESRLIYGGYPEVVLAEGFLEKRETLESILDGALYKDILTVEGMKKSGKIVNLLKLLAFQVGSLVSMRELGEGLGLNVATVQRYLDILEKLFIIKGLWGFRRNLRSEVIKTNKYYFWDNGIRNALINNYNELGVRNDIGQLWENYLFIERMKKREYQKIYANSYFWRTHEQKEIDLIEEMGGELYAYEFKWGKKGAKEPRSWKMAYPGAGYKVITPGNYLEFISE